MIGNTSGNNSLGAHIEPTIQLSNSFCNSFWANSSQPTELTQLGYDTITQRIKDGTKSLDSTKKFFQERAAEEDDIAKKQLKAKSQLATLELGHLQLALQLIDEGVKGFAKTHSGLATYLKSLSTQIEQFTDKRESSRKKQQTDIERCREDLIKYEAAVEKARAKYHNECIKINELNARSALLQGPSLYKVQSEMANLEASVGPSKATYHSHIKVLASTTSKWVLLWKAYCDTCQDQEEERLEFMKNRFWDYSNALSTAAVNFDESAEKNRIALEQCIPARDLVVFVELKGTGNEIPDAPPPENFSSNGPAPRRTWKKANFIRSSIRVGVNNAPSPIENLSKAISSSAAPVPPPSPSRQPTSSPQKNFSGLSAFESAISAPRSAGTGTISRPPADVRTTEPRATRPTLETSFDSMNLSTASAMSAPAPPTPTKLSVSSSVSTVDEEDDPIARMMSSPSRSQPRTRQISTASRSTTSIDLGTRSPSPSAPRTPSQGRSVTENNLRLVQAPLEQQPRSVSPAPSSRYRAPSPSASMMHPPSANQVPAVVGSYGQAFPGERERRPSSISTPNPDPRQRHQSMPNSNRYSTSNLASPGPGPDPYARASSPTPFAGVGARGRSPSPQPFLPPRSNSPAMLNSRPSSYSNPPSAYNAPPPRSPSPYAQPLNQPPANYRNSISKSPSRNEPSQFQSPAGAPPNNHTGMRNSMSFPLGAPPPVDSTRQNSNSNYPPPSQYPTYYASQQQYQSTAPSSNQGYQYQEALNPNLGGVARTSSHSAGSSYSASSAWSPAPPAQAYPPARPPAAGFTASGQRILHHVRAMFDYEATGDEYFSFQAGDIIAVTAKAEDGWWQGQRVGDTGYGGTTFPSNFVEFI